MTVLYACMHVYHMHEWWLKRSEGIRALGAGASDGGSGS